MTDELQVHGQTSNNVVNWIVGYYHELDHPGGYSEVDRSVFGGGSAFPPLSSTEIQSLGNGGTSDAVYASANYDMGTWVKGLSFTTGGRYTWDHKVATALECAVPPAPGCPSPLTSVFAQPTLQANFHAPSWTLSADYQATDIDDGLCDLSPGLQERRLQQRRRPVIGLLGIPAGIPDRRGSRHEKRLDAGGRAGADESRRLLRLV